MRWAVLALNRQSVEQALYLRKQCYKLCSGIDIYTLGKYIEEDLYEIKGSLISFNEKIFNDYKVIIYIMAMGIVVRDIAPWIRHKSVDPAVLCYSVDGSYIIPVLSGHLGGANRISRQIAGNTGSQAVITTASDILGTSAVDMMAQSRDLTIDSYEDAKTITAMMINGDKVCLYTDTSMEGTIGTMVLSQSMDEDAKGLIYIGYRKHIAWQKAMAQLIPKSLVLGIGARRGTTLEKIRSVLEQLMDDCGFDIRGIGKIASIDLKAHEPGIRSLADTLKVPFITYNSETLARVEDLFETSDFVREITGVGAVAMPSGYLASNKGKCLADKRAKDGITMCLWEEQL